MICLGLELALSPNNNEVHVYQKDNSKWSLQSVLNQHDLRVTSIDWGQRSNRIVTCSAVSCQIENEISLNLI